MLGTCTLWNIPKQYRTIVKEEVKLLGLMISNSVDNNIEIFFRKAINKMKANIAISNSCENVISQKNKYNKNNSDLTTGILNVQPTSTTRKNVERNRTTTKLKKSREKN